VVEATIGGRPVFSIASDDSLGEIMPPLADAMGFIHGEQVDLILSSARINSWL
jgi:hypothetical protein